MKPLIKKTTTIAAGLALALTLSACASWKRGPAPGTPLADVTAKLGKPDAVYPEPDGGQVLEYRGQPMGQTQHMARFGKDGRLVSYEQVLTDANFDQVRVNFWTKDDVLRHFGRPAEVSRERLQGFEVWSYRYQRDIETNSFKNFYFNGRGELHAMDNSPDPLLDDRFKGM